jgi:hypothetical protein
MVNAVPLRRRDAAPSAPRGVLRGVVGAARIAAGVGVAVALGAVIGVLSTAAAIRTESLGTRRAGAWRVFGDVGTPGINPYQHARMAHTGEIPLAAAQGLTLVARVDDGGQTLDSACTYRVSGPVPHARFWTLTAASTTGHPFPNPAGREAFTSTDVLRDIAGRAVVALSPTVQPGNWLPLPGTGHFALVLRLYDAGMAGPGSPIINGASVPAIARVGCGA